MSVQKASCVYRGNTFYCDYSVVGSGATRQVHVRYNGEEIMARAAGRPPQAVAEILLGELVVREGIALKVAETMRPEETAATIRGDTRERSIDRD